VTSSKTQLAQQLARERIDKWDYMKLKGFCAAKEVVSKLKRLPNEWEKIFTIYISGRDLINRIYGKFEKVNSKKINDPVKK
jgi:hypothetical protein